MVNPGPEQPAYGREYPSLENSPPPIDPGAPVNYPTDAGSPPMYAATFGAQPPPGYPAPIPGHPQYQAPYPYSYDPYGAMRPPGTNGKAIASLVTSLAGLLLLCGLSSPVGLVLGILGFRETKRTGQEGNGLALAGIIIGAIGTVLLIVMAVYFLIVIGLIASTSHYNSF